VVVDGRSDLVVVVVGAVVLVGSVVVVVVVVVVVTVLEDFWFAVAAAMPIPTAAPRSSDSNANSQTRPVLIRWPLP
jgi:hypothetical protein